MPAVTGQLVWCHGCMAGDNVTAAAVPGGAAAESLAAGALDWLLGAAQDSGAGLTWAPIVPGAPVV